MWIEVEFDTIIYYFDHHKRLSVILKIAILVSVAFYSFYRIGTDWIAIMRFLSGLLGSNLTNEQAGSIWAFCTSLPIALLVPVLFVDEISSDTIQVQMTEHAKVLRIAKIEESHLIKSVRYLGIPGHVYAEPQIIVKWMQRPLLILPFILFNLFTFVLHSVLVFFPVIPLFSIYEITLNIIGISFMLWVFYKIYCELHGMYMDWRSFWESYWSIIYVRSAPLDDAIEFTTKSQWSSSKYNLSDNLSKDEFIKTQIEVLSGSLDFDISLLLKNLSSFKALDVLELYRIAENEMAAQNDILSNDDAKRMLSPYIKKITSLPLIQSISFDAYCRDACVLIQSLRLGKNSSDALLDTLSLKINESNRLDFLTIAGDNIGQLELLPSRIWPNSINWVLIAYSIAATAGLLLGPILTSLLNFTI
jgi:hypothetical protein